MIHPTAIIEEGAIVEDVASIGPFCYIGKEVVIHQGVSIASHTKLLGRVDVAKDVKIFSHVSIGHLQSSITIGRGSHIREFVQIGVDSDENRAITIGSEAFIMAYVQLFSGVTIGDNAILTNAVIMRKNSRCEERVIIGGLSSVDEDVTIGTGVMIGGASHIKNALPPFTLIEGNPAKIKGLNTIGIRRRFNSDATSQAIKESYKRIYNSEVPNKEVAKEMVLNINDANAKRFATFVLEHC